MDVSRLTKHGKKLKGRLTALRVFLFYYRNDALDESDGEKIMLFGLPSSRYLQNVQVLTTMADLYQLPEPLDSSSTFKQKNLPAIAACGYLIAIIGYRLIPSSTQYVGLDCALW